MTAGRDRKGFWRSNSLPLCFGAAFLVVLGAQAVAGRAEFDEQSAVQGLQQDGFGDYLMSSDLETAQIGVAVGPEASRHRSWRSWSYDAL